MNCILKDNNTQMILTAQTKKDIDFLNYFFERFHDDNGIKRCES